MANGKNLRKAKLAKKDEFYTQWSDIEKEMNAYVEYNKSVFRGKTILLPADDPFESNFFKFFATKFNEYGLKKLIATSYAPSPIVNTQLTLLPELVPEKEIEQARDKQITEAYKIELNEVVDENETGTVNIDDVITRLLKEKEVIDSGGTSSILSYLKGDNNPDGINNFSAGDFRSQEVSKLRDEADIIITNPPFSLFREFIDWVNPRKKQLSVIGNVNSLTYKNIFPLIKDNELWLGESIHSGDREFKVPDSYPLKSSGWRIDNEGNKYIRVKGVRWFTNINHGRRHQPLSLMTMAENVKFSKHKEVRGYEYKKYENYEGIEVPYTDAIPSDFHGAMGVPITFLDKYNPEQFKILGLGIANLGLEAGVKPYSPEHKKYRKEVQKRGAVDGDLYMLDKDGIPNVPYARVLIKKKGGI